MLWSKQFYNYDVDRWLSERGADPFKPRRQRRRATTTGTTCTTPTSSRCRTSGSIPWYAAWDLAFHVLALTLVDEDFGKQQLDLMLQERYLHPSGQIPAYEWNFGDVNPPVHAWSTIFTYRLEKARRGEATRMARALVPQAAAQLHLVGQPEGPRRATTSSKAASSGSTTSACSIAARRCRPAATSNRRTAPRGWRCSARTCSRSPPSWRCEKPAYADMCAQVRRALPLDRVVDGPRRRRRRHVGRGGRLLLRRAAAARRRRASG